MINYFLKYYIYDSVKKSFRSSFVLPLLTIIVGSFVMMVSFSIMEGFSKEIKNTVYFFDKEYSISINKNEFINNNSDKDIENFINYLIKKEYFFNSYEDRVMFIEGNQNKITTRVYGINQFENFSPLVYLLNSSSSNNLRGLSDCYIGYNHFINLNIETGDSIQLHSILDFNNLSSFPSENYKIKGIIKTNIPRYDNSVYIQYDSLLFSKNIFLNINLNKPISEQDLNEINNKFASGYYYNEKSHLFSELFYAINFEKLFYLYIGLFIVLISGIMIIGFNVSSIMRNVSKIALLEVIGLQKKYISLSYFYYGIFISSIGFIGALFIFKILLFFDANYQIMNYIFDPNVYFNFNLELSNNIIIRIFLLDIFLISLSNIYPLYKISKLDIIESIKNRV